MTNEIQNVDEAADNYVKTELASYNQRYKEAGRKDFIAGYKAAIQSSTKTFTLEDIEKAFELLHEVSYNLNKGLWQWGNPQERGIELGNKIEQYIQSLSNG